MDRYEEAKIRTCYHCQKKGEATGELLTHLPPGWIIYSTGMWSAIILCDDCAPKLQKILDNLKRIGKKFEQFTGAKLNFLSDD